MSERRQVQTMLERTSEERRAGFLPALPGLPKRELRNSPSSSTLPALTTIAKSAARSQQCGPAKACGSSTGPAAVPEPRVAAEKGPLLFGGNGGLQEGTSNRCFHRTPYLPDSPVTHSATRSVLIPRPSALGVLLRMGQPAKEGLHDGTAGPCALTGFGFQKIFRATNAKKISRTFRKSTPSALGSGAHSHPTTHKSCVGGPGISRRVAQECPE